MTTNTLTPTQSKMIDHVRKQYNLADDTTAKVTQFQLTMWNDSSLGFPLPPRRASVQVMTFGYDCTIEIGETQFIVHTNESLSRIIAHTEESLAKLSAQRAKNLPANATQ